MTRRLHLAYTALMAATALALASPVAHATVIPPTTTFSSPLDYTNDADLGAGPFGTVDISLTGTVATITFTAAPGFGFVDSHVADLSLNAASWTFDSGCAGCTSILTETGSNNVDGEGVFNFTSTIGNAATPLSSIMFQLTSAAFTNAASVLTANSSGFDAAAHVSLLSAGGATTGFVGELVNPSAVPEPATLGLLASGVLGLGFMARSRQRKPAAS